MLFFLFLLIEQVLNNSCTSCGSIESRNTHTHTRISPPTPYWSVCYLLKTAPSVKDLRILSNADLYVTKA